MKILDHYLRQVIFLSTAFISVVLIAIQSFLELIQQFGYIGQYQYNIWDAIISVPMQLPSDFYQLFPMASFLGCMIGLGRLASTSQLIAMRASGVSVARITWSVMKAAVPMIIIATFIGEGIGPFLKQQAEQLQQFTSQTKEQRNTPGSIWVRQGDSFTNINSIKSNNKIFGITRYQFGTDNRLKQIAFAKTGQLEKGKWTLFHLHETEFTPDKIIAHTQQKETMNFVLKPKLQMHLENNVMLQSIKDLMDNIHYRSLIGLGANQITYTLWQRVLQPLTSLILICLAVPFVFGSSRNSSMGLQILSGVVLGFLFYMMNQLLGPVTLVYQFPPILAAIIPTAIFFILLFVLLLRVQ